MLFINSSDFLEGWEKSPTSWSGSFSVEVSQSRPDPFPLMETPEPSGCSLSHATYEITPNADDIDKRYLVGSCPSVSQRMPAARAVPVGRRADHQPVEACAHDRP